LDVCARVGVAAAGSRCLRSLFAPMLPESQQAIDKIGAWVKQTVRTGAAA